MPGADEGNLLGHWEPPRIVKIHDRFLSESGTGWDDILEYPDAIFHSPVAAAHRRRVQAIVGEEYRDAPLFVLKDPRTSRLMPLWRPVLAQLGVAPHALITVRNPLEIADSLLARNGWDEYRALIVWLRYMLAAERDTRDLPRCFVRYDRLIDDWRSVITDISDRLRIVFPPRSPAAAARIDKFLSRDMRHHRRPSVELLYRGDVADCIKDAYRCFCEAADSGKMDFCVLDAIAASLVAAERVFSRIRANADDPALRAISMDVPQLGKRDALFALTLAELGRARDGVARAEAKLNTILKSWSWRFTRPLRGAFYVVKRLRSSLQAKLA